MKLTKDQKEKLQKLNGKLQKNLIKIQEKHNSIANEKIQKLDLTKSGVKKLIKKIEASSFNSYNIDEKKIMNDHSEEYKKIMQEI